MPKRAPSNKRPASRYVQPVLDGLGLGPALLALVLAGCALRAPAPDTAAVEPVAAAHAPMHFVLVETPVVELPTPPAEEADLLARIRRQLVLPTHRASGELDPLVKRELDWFAAHPEYLDRVFTRAEPYLYFIVNELEARKMPLDLALLPVIESAFDPFAYSRGRAAGLWQIIPSTGRRLGLKQDWWFDARRDVVQSTRAALDYLEELADQFDGDWLLAVAGYNSGEGNVVRALARAGASPEQSATFWDARPYLPVETRTYVPRLLALIELVSAPQNYDLSLPALANEPYFAPVETGGQIDMALAAELAGIEAEKLYKLNPGVNRWATDPEGPDRLLVPADAADTLSDALDALGERERVSWSRHRVKAGESLIAIASHYQTTPALLRDVNGISGNLIRAGDFLMVPHAVKSLAAYTESADARAARTRATVRAGLKLEHVVAPGESLWSIARRYDVNVRNLAAWNAMAPGDVLSIGRKLVVWSRKSSLEVAMSGTPTANAQIRRVTYTVRRGDSLSAIATRFRVRLAELVRWNSLSLEGYLKPGQKLIMYVDVTEQSG